MNDLPDEPDAIMFKYQPKYHKEVDAWQRCALEIMQQPERYGKSIVYTVGELCGEVDIIYLN